MSLVDLNGKNVLVTGAFGLLGKHIVRALSQRGANVVALQHSLHSTDTLLSDPAHIVQGDITSLIDMLRVMSTYEVDYIFHLAANAIVRKCARDPISCFETNIMGTAVVLEAARQTGTVKGVLCMESDKSYGSFDPSDLPYREDQALKPANTYEVSKACSGLIAKAYDHNYNLPTFSIRGANLYGPGDTNLSRLVPGSIMSLLSKKPPTIYKPAGLSTSAEGYIREFIYVEDAAEICVQLMEKIDETRGLPINLGSGEVASVGEVIRKIISLTGINIEPVVVEQEPQFKEIEKQYLDLTRLKSFIGDYPFVSLDEGLARTIDWYKEKFREGVLAHCA